MLSPNDILDLEGSVPDACETPCNEETRAAKILSY